MALTIFLIVRDAVNHWFIINNISLWPLIPTIFFSVLDIAIDFSVWFFFLTRVNKTSKLFSSLLIFLAGFAIDLAPAKVGEFSRTFFLRAIHGIPVREGAAVQINSFFVDYCSVSIIGITELLLFQLTAAAAIVMLFSVLIMLFFLRILQYESLQPFVQRMARRFVPAEIFFGISELQGAVTSLLKTRYCLSLIPVKALSWFSMGMALFYLSRAFGFPLSFSECLFTVTLSSLLGTFSMIPHGFAITEASLVGFQVYFNMPLNVAVIVAFVFRGINLWSWLIIGNLSAQIVIKKLTVQPKAFS